MFVLSDRNKAVTIKHYCQSTWCLRYPTDHNRAVIYSVIYFSMGALVVVILEMKWKGAENDPLAEAVKRLSQACVHHVSCMLVGGCWDATSKIHFPNFSFRVSFSQETLKDVIMKLFFVQLLLQDMLCSSPELYTLWLRSTVSEWLRVCSTPLRLDCLDCVPKPWCV